MPAGLKLGPGAPTRAAVLPPTNIGDPDYFHKVVDCQWACPAHTPVPEYIRLIAAGRYTDAYMLNWESNVFPGILGRTCDRPCEPACRRGRVEKEPVAICRLKRVAADNKDDITGLLPKPPASRNGRRVALVGAGPASLTVARDLLPLGYEVVLFDGDPRAGGMIRSQIPKFRLPESVIDEEVGDRFNTRLIKRESHRRNFQLAVPELIAAPALPRYGQHTRELVFPVVGSGKEPNALRLSHVQFDPVSQTTASAN